MVASGDARMNKTLALIAVVLSLITAFFIVNAGGSDAYVYDVYDDYGNGYFAIDDADTRTYTDADLSSIILDNKGRIYIDTETVMDGAFRDCTKIKKVYLGEGIKHVGDSAFEGCSNLINVLVDDGLESIGDSAFKDSGIGEIILPESVTDIGADAFNGCTRLHSSVLFGTSVTELKSGVFKGSGLYFEDLRNITSISSTAFTNTNLHGQVLREGQTAKIAGVTAVYVSDFEILDLYMIEDGFGYTLKIVVDDNVSLMNKESNGDLTPYNSDGEIWSSVEHTCSLLMSGSDFHLELLKYRIHFEDYLGMNDVVHISGSGTYTMPSPSVGSSIFKGWKIDGFNGYKAALTEADFQTAGMLIEPVAEFEDLTLTLDHSNVSGSPDYPGLTTSLTFSVNSTYPEQDNITGYSFSGWMVGDVFHAAGSKITNLTDHTARSVWNAEMLVLTLVYADGSSTTQQVLTGSIIDLVNLETAEPVSKRHIGWSLSENGTILTSNPTMNSNMRLYAVFSDRDAFTIRYMDGSTVLGTQSGYDGRIVTVDIDDPEADGKVISRWMLGDQRIENGDTFTLTQNVDIVSIWNTVTLNITYHVGSNAIMTYDYGNRVTLNYDAGSMSGYVFSGWSTTQNGPVIYTNGDEITITSNIDLYPCWISNGKLVVTLHDYLGRSSQTEVDPDSEYIIPNPTDREGKTFSGWGIIPGGDVVYRTGQTLTITDNTDLYEKWTDIVSFTVSIHTYSGNVNENVVNSGSTFQLPSVDAREGYSFNGWAATSNGYIAYRSGDSIRIVSDLDLYEIWSVNAPTELSVIVHDFQGNTNEVRVANGEQFTVPTPSTREGYSFIGWSLTDNGAKNYDAGDDITITSNIHLYQKWDGLRTFKVTVHSEPIIERTAYEGQTITVTLPNMSRTGYSLTGWSTTANSSTAQYATTNTVTATDTTDYYPVWVSKPIYTVKIHLTGTSTTDRTVYSGESIRLPTSLGVSEGKKHEGWTTKNDGTGKFYSAGSIIYPTESMELFTFWSDPEMVKLNLNDSSTTMTSINVQKGTTYDLSEVEDLSKEGHLLVGWSKSRLSSTIAYELSDSITVSSDTTIYAVWEKLIKVIFHDGDMIDVKYVQKGDSIELPSPVKNGYSFEGWTLKDSGSIVRSLEPTVDTDLYSKWKVIESNPDKSVSEETPSEKEGSGSDDNRISQNTVPTKSGGSGLSITTIGIGAAVAAIVSVLFVFQMRRA